MPYRWVGTKQSPSKPHYLYHGDEVVLYTDHISPEYAGKVAASLNANQALEGMLAHEGHPLTVPAKGGCHNFVLPDDVIQAARAALALARGGNK